ncbi:MAG: asparaginase, partial [Burkholderiaceae bacterium]|nr:asparaginase [Burkholderiaceae bacterium]
MKLAPLVELTRGGTLENQHFGAVAVVDLRGRVLAQAGDAHWLTFTRSTLKALQALPFVEAGGPQRFGFTQAQVALLCASHSGEPMHVEAVQGMLDKSGLDCRRLLCGCQVPMFTELGLASAAEQVFDERHHNCSGKHAGFLAYCVQHGL